MVTLDSARTSPEPTGAHPFCINVHEHFVPHAHPYHELVVIQRGRLRARVGDVEHIAVAGDVLLYPSGAVHEEWAENGEPVLTWVCRFLWADLKPTDALFCHDLYGRVQEAMTQITLEYMDNFKLRGRPETRLAMLKAILAELERLVLREPEATIHRVRSYIKAHIADPFDLDDLTAISGLSKSYLVRQYRSVTGRTPMEDVRSLRLEEARQLLIHTSLPLYEIAPRVGIPDVCRLSRLLKTCLGVGARKLRQEGKRESCCDSSEYRNVAVQAHLTK